LKTIVCFGDSNTWGCVPLTDEGPPRRYSANERWPGVLRKELGDSYWIVEEGLNGRTTVWDDPLSPYRSGKDHLLPVLLSHRWIDLVVVMLGTNDLKSRFGASARDIAEGAGRLVYMILRSECGPGQSAPQVLLMCPPPLARLTTYAGEFAGGAEKSRELAAEYAAVAEAHGCALLDAGETIRSSDVDGIHFDASEHEKLGRAVAARVRELIG
jgi:lysophospholipase L1-like esterase